MKKSISISILALLFTIGSTIPAQNHPSEYLGLPGDNLNLYAVMNLFQESETLEGFERDLNDPDSRINNLDLNADNYVDYIIVSDFKKGNVHNIVLRVALDSKNYQDVAVFIVEQLRNESVQVQLIGDEALYGKNYIIEPNYAETRNPGYMGPKAQTNQVNVVRTNYYEVAAWPVIRFIYRPGYKVWHSSWYWGNYPSHWVSWRPYYWDYYYGYHSNWHPHYYSWYRHCNYHRWKGYHKHYYSHARVYSPTVVVNINKGRYRSTYSRPDQRSAGEALYTSVRSGRSTNNRNSTVYRSLERQSASSRTESERGTSVRSARTGQQTRTAVSNDNTRTARTEGQPTATGRRTSSAVNNNSYTRPTSGHRTSTESRRRESAVQTRTSRSSSSNNSSSNGNNPASQVRRSVPVQSSAQRTTKTRNSGTPASMQRSSNTRIGSSESTLQGSNNSKSPAVSVQQSSRSSRSSVGNSRSASPKATVQQSAPSRSSERSAPGVSSSSPNKNSSKAVSKTRSSSQKSSSSGDERSSRSQRE